jgi:hypothetical protein
MATLTTAARDPLSLATERHYTVQEVAEMWAMSSQTVYRIFEDEAGTLKVSFPRLLSKQAKRAPRVSLRIPASVLARVHDNRSRGFGREFQLRRS